MAEVNNHLPFLQRPIKQAYTVMNQCSQVCIPMVCCCS